MNILNAGNGTNFYVEPECEYMNNVDELLTVLYKKKDILNLICTIMLFGISANAWLKIHLK